MKLTKPVLQAFLNCSYKAWQLFHNALSTDSETNNKVAEKAFLMNQPGWIPNSIKISSVDKQAEKLLQQAKGILSTNESPPFYKIPHCLECQFNAECTIKLKERDCLSLLGGMTPKIIAKYKSRGITTVTQLSHLFRPRRRRQGPQTSGRYSWELKALAIREHKTFVLHLPELSETAAAIYLDFEGVPEEHSYYLIGGIVKEEGKEDRFFSLWADTIDDEYTIFMELINILRQYPQAPVYHFGSYEVKALKSTAKKYPALLKKGLHDIEKRLVNLLGFLRSHVYPPTYTNGLKELANYLAFTWSDKEASGLMSIDWRKQWSASKDITIKDRLLLYNREDCEALLKVHSWLVSISKNDNQENIQQVSTLKRYTPYKLQSNIEFGEDFQVITKASYFDYQRSKIYWRDERSAVKKKKHEKIKQKGVLTWHPKQINEVVIVPSLKSCPHCGHKKLYHSRVDSRRTKVLQTDLKFTAAGIHTHVTEYQSGRCKCAQCGKKTSDQSLRMMQFGDNFFAYVVNLYVTCHISHEMISRILKEQFAIQVKHMYLVMRKEHWWMQNWQPEVNYIRKIVLDSPVIHIDETSVRLFQNRGYVWVFTTKDTVYYHFTLTREAGFLKDWLKDYKGTIVTDFFPGYEMLDVRKQKCLVHLIRDLNDELFKNPFNDEYRILVSSFGKLLKEIVYTIDKHGLQKRSLENHKTDIDLFYKQFIEPESKSELMIKYTKRLRKHWDQLWTFIHFDGIPWNNNNAEAAIKAFAQHRRGVNGQIKESGLRLYLQMLSVAQTCRYREVSFLDFLRKKVGLWEQVPVTSLPGFLPFQQARLFIHRLGFERKQQWDDWKTEGKRPSFIPSNPNVTYKSCGWMDWQDWIGFSFLSFPKARTFMRRLHFKSRNEYVEWLRSGKRPKYIPYDPKKAYKYTGWTNWQDYLGN